MKPSEYPLSSEVKPEAGYVLDDDVAVAGGHGAERVGTAGAGRRPRAVTSEDRDHDERHKQ